MGTYLLGIEILLRISWHVLGKSEGLHAAQDGRLDDFFELVFCVARAELPGVTVH